MKFIVACWIALLSTIISCAWASFRSPVISPFSPRPYKIKLHCHFRWAKDKAPRGFSNFLLRSHGEEARDELVIAKIRPSEENSITYDLMASPGVQYSAALVTYHAIPDESQNELDPTEIIHLESPRFDCSKSRWTIELIKTG